MTGSAGNVNDEKPGFGIVLNGSNKIGIRFHDPTARNEFVDAYGDMALPIERWVHFAITVDTFDDTISGIEACPNNAV